MRPSSSARRSAGACPDAVRVAPARGGRPAVDREAELLGQAGQAQQAHGVVAQGGRRSPGAAGRPARSARPPWRSMTGARGASGTARALTVRSRRARSSARCRPWSGRDVDLASGRSPPCTRHAPKAAREAEAACRRGPGQSRAAAARGVAVDRHVEVGHRAADQRVAHAAPHRPGRRRGARAGRAGARGPEARSPLVDPRHARPRRRRSPRS